MADVTMPALGESVTEGTVTRWLKAQGERVEVDEPLLEVSTDKVDTEIPSPVAGVLQEILVGEDETVEVGARLAVVGDGAAAPQQPAQPAAEEAKPAPAQAESEPEPAQPAAESAPEPQQPSAAPAGDHGGQGVPVPMPALGESVTEGTVTRWLKAEGDTVEVDEPLLEVSTDKVDTEIPSPVAGTIVKILVGEDETASVGADLVIIGAPGSAAPAAATAEHKPEASQPAQVPTQPAAPATATPAASAPATAAPAAAAPVKAEPREQFAGSSRSEAQVDAAGETLYVTPLVRKLAAEHNVDLTAITGSGVGGRIRKQDVLAAAERPAAPTGAPVAATPPARSAAPAASSNAGVSADRMAELGAKRGTSEPMSRLRKVIASRMVESLQVSAQLTTVVEVDVTAVARLRAAHKEEFAAREGVKLSFMPFFALAAIEALKQFPQVNASVEGDNIVYHAQENLGIAVDTEMGLIVPVIKDAGDLNIAGLARKIDDLAARTRGKKVTPDELSGGTFTLTNTGSRGALFDTPIINQPQVAILGTGAVVKRPVVVTDIDGSESIAVRSMVYLALTYDHRLVDGADAARFLTNMKERLEHAQFEV